MKKKTLPSEKQLIDISVNLKGIDEEKRTIYGATASDGLLDRHGESLNPSGWKINGNVPILWGHDYSALPIGKTSQIYVEKGELKFDGFLSQKYEFAKTVFDLISEGIIEKVSVGFIPLKWDESGEFTYSEMELLEISFVSVPANPRAGIKQVTIDKLKTVEDSLAELKALVEKKEAEADDLEPELEVSDSEEEEKDENEPSEEVEPQVESEEQDEDEETEEKFLTLSADELSSLIKDAVSEGIKLFKEKQDQKVSDEAVEAEAKTKEALIAMRELLKSSDKSTELALKKLKEIVEK